MTGNTLEQRAAGILSQALADLGYKPSLAFGGMIPAEAARAAVEAALRLSTGADGATFRALRGNDALQSDDEILHDDCITWGPPPAWVVGMQYDPALHVPARRRLAAAPRHETGE